MSIRFAGAVALSVMAWVVGDSTVAAAQSSEPAPSEPAPSEPAPSEPAPSEPAPSSPAAASPAPSSQAPATAATAATAAPTPASHAPAAPSPKRELPDYDGRGNPEADADHWALWIPRSLLAPLYVVHEYVIRRPLGVLITVAERDRWINTIAELFSFGPNRQFMLIPTAVYDFGFRPNAGLRFTADHLFVRNHDLIAHAATGGTDWWIASVRDRYRWNQGNTAAATHFDLVRRPDLVFRGIGPNAREGEGSRYGLQKLDAGAWGTHRMAGAQVVAAAGVRRMAFRSAECCDDDDPRLEDQVAAGEIEPPPGYGAPYTVAYQSLSLALDSRAPRPAPGTGARLSMYASTGFDPGHDRSWIRYGGALGGAVDVTGQQRTLRLQVAADLVDPMQGDVIPFTELVSMTDQNLMQGFTGGWMIGRSTIAAELGYSWPVAFLLDGNARLSVGNAFGARLDGFAADQLRLSADIGVTTIGARDSGFELIFGVGTSSFEQGAGIDSVRFAVGSRRGI